LEQAKTLSARQLVDSEGREALLAVLKKVCEAEEKSARGFLSPGWDASFERKRSLLFEN
jgi:hypothetical protein